MMRSGALASVLVDDALAASVVPFPCPSNFGPEGRYRLEELISPGRRSVVYRATDQKFSSQGFEARVAIKIFPDGVGRDEPLAARRISHRHVLSIHDRGVDPGGLAYMVSEYVDGGDLSQANPPWAPARAAGFIAKVAGAVQAAHSAGIIHCDLKPANILLTADGEPKLADFDLSRWSDQDDTDARGNAAFMAPEQFRGEANGLAPPADVYALGGLLYWLLTGKLPHGATAEEVAATHASRQVAPSPGVGGDLEIVCRRALAPRSDQRYRSAGELADDLQRWLRHEPIPWVRISPLRRAGLWARRWPVKAAALALVVLSAAVSLAALQYSAAKERAHRARAQEEAVRLANEAVQRTRARMRSTIEHLSRTLTAPTLDLQDRVLPMLVWIDWLADMQLIGESGSVPSVARRTEQMRAMIATEDSPQGRGQLLDLLARYSLAYYLVEQEETREPVELLGQVREIWSSRLPPEDPFWLSVSGVERCARALVLRDGGRLPEAIAELEALADELALDGRAEPVRRLAERALLRVRGKARR